MRCQWVVRARWTVCTLVFLLPTVVTGSLHAQLIVTGVIDGPLAGGTPKAIELYVTEDIDDLSTLAIGSANNGGGSKGPEFTFPGDTAMAGDFIYLAMEAVEFENYFAFPPTYTHHSALSINGDDAIEVFRDGQVIDTFGQIDLSGTGQPWEYMDGWAYRVDQTGPDGSTFVLDNWLCSGPDVLDGESANDAAFMPAPFGTYAPAVAKPVNAPVVLQAGDADQDFDFDQLDLVQVQIAARYLSDQPATWGEGDWDGAPGGQVGSPPDGDGFFDQMDIVAALTANVYLAGPYAALDDSGLPVEQPTAIPVPEPTSLWLACAGLWCAGILAIDVRRSPWHARQ
jgi:hypothetical protein